MDRLLDQFDLVLVINLVRRADRRREMLAQLKNVDHEVGGHIQWFPAVEPAEPAGFRTIGARGCFLSHLGCIRQAIRQGAGSLLILEDDANFRRDYMALQGAVCSALETEDWGMFYGGGSVMGNGGTAQMVAPGVAVLVDGAAIQCAHCVAVHGDRLRELEVCLSGMLERPAGDARGGPMDVDGAYAWFQEQAGVRVLLAEPQLAYQRPSASDITPGRLDDVSWLRYPLQLARALKRRLGNTQ